MKLRGVIAGVMLVPSVAMAWPWSTDMMNQPNIKPQEGTMVPFPTRSIPIQGLGPLVANREETREMVNPISATAESVKEGRVLYKIYCATCHGTTGNPADAPVGGKIGAIALNDDYVQQTMSEGWIWGTITFGSYVMPSYGVPRAREDSRGSNDLSVEERWHVVNYIKHGMVKDHAARTAAAK